MLLHQAIWTLADGWSNDNQVGSADLQDEAADLVLVFGADRLLRRQDWLEGLRRRQPRALIAGCSTAGEIAATRVLDDSIVATWIKFGSSRASGCVVDLRSCDDDSRAVGVSLAAGLSTTDLVHVLVFSDGHQVNGSELVAGLQSQLPAAVTLTGGLAGGGLDMGPTSVVFNSAGKDGLIAVVGLYGERLQVGIGSLGGWDPFGPERLITRSSGNVLYELDEQSALELYKTYLGDRAAQLPASALLFPLSLRLPTGDHRLVRTVLSVDEAASSMTFAGDMPEGAWAQLMKANFERLIDGAIGAANTSLEALGKGTPPQLGLLISCVGRRLVLGQRIEEEVEEAAEILGRGVMLAGFYSQGEIAPFAPSSSCELHNQTMTITTLAER